jgi:hypothetical protein
LCGGGRWRWCGRHCDLWSSLGCSEGPGGDMEDVKGGA